MRVRKQILSRLAMAGFFCCWVALTAVSEELGVMKAFYGTPSGSAALFPFQDHVQAGVLNATTVRHSGGTDLLDNLDVSNIPAGDPMPKVGLWNYIINSGGTPPSFTWSNLTPNANYLVYIYTYEGYYTDVNRQFSVSFNGTTATSCVFKGMSHDGVMIPYADAGSRKDSSCRYEFSATADAEGKIAVQFVNKKDNSQFTGAVLLGATTPGEPDAPEIVRLPGDAGCSVSWSGVRDALAYYVERSTDNQTTWQTVGQGVETSVTVPALSTGENIYYRVVASNGVGVVRGAVATVLPAAVRRVRYAFNFGAVTESVGRFVPVQPDYFRGHAYPSVASVTGIVPADYQGDLAPIYSTFVTGRKSDDPLVVKFDGLAPNATYGLRWHSIETSDVGEGVRLGTAWVNGTVALENFDIRKETGGTGIPAFVDFEGTADADGNLELKIVSSNADRQAIVCALELFEQESVAVLPAPSPFVIGSAEMIRIVPENRHAQFAYDIQYSDAEPSVGSDGTTFATGVTSAGIADLSVAAGGTRWYRARATHVGAQSAWSPWVRATREGRSAYAPVMVYCSGTRQQNLEDLGWTWDKPFRVSPIDYNAYGKRADSEVYDLSGVKNPAPMDVYRLYLADNHGGNGTNYVHLFSGFDPSVTYRVRLHVQETYFDPSISVDPNNARVWTEEANGLCDMNSAFYRISPYKLAGATFRAAVAECDVKPDLRGQIRLEAIYVVQYAQYRGIEIVPLDAPSGRGSSRTAIYAKTGETLLTAEDAELVAERAESTLRWDANTLPAEASVSPRIDSHGFLYAPCADDYVFTFAAEGRVRLWLDGKFIFQGAASAASPLDSAAVRLAAGVHEYHLDYAPTSAAVCSFSASWRSTAQGDLGSLGDYLLAWDDPIGLTDSWRIFALGRNTYPPPFAVRRGACVRLYGSGSDMWSSTDEGTILFRKAKRGFRMRMHVKAVGGENVHSTSTRFGLEMRSSLDTPANYGFAMYSGFSLDGTFRSYADTTVDDVCNMSNTVDPWKNAAITGFKPPVPIYLSATRTRVAGSNWRYVFSYSKDGVDAAFARTQEIAKATSVYVGPTVCAYTGSSHCGDVLAWMDLDEITFEEDPVPGVVIIYR